MKEKDFWKKLRKSLFLEYVKRIEVSGEEGWPDIYYLHRMNPGFIELKYSDKFPTKIRFEQGQPLWHKEYFDKGGQSYIFLYVKSEMNIYIWQGRHAFDLKRAKELKKVKPFLKVQDNRLGWRQIQKELF